MSFPTFLISPQTQPNRQMIPRPVSNKYTSCVSIWPAEAIDSLLLHDRPKGFEWTKASRAIKMSFRRKFHRSSEIRQHYNIYQNGSFCYRRNATITDVTYIYTQAQLNTRLLQHENVKHFWARQTPPLRVKCSSFAFGRTDTIYIQGEHNLPKYLPK